MVVSLSWISKTVSLKTSIASRCFLPFPLTRSRWWVLTRLAIRRLARGERGITDDTRPWRERNGLMGALVKVPFPQIKTFPTPLATPWESA